MKAVADYPCLITSDEELITVIGRGNSGTRMLAHAFLASGVFLGTTLNNSGDSLPPEPMYEACKTIARHVHWAGGLSWEFDELHTMSIDPAFEEFVLTYLADVLSSRRPQRGWKLPETTLAFPWIVRMFPSAKYVHIVRDPRDALLSGHITDDLSVAGIRYPRTSDKLAQRVASWKYQHEIVKATPRPAHFLSVRYEDLVLEHDATMRKLEEFLAIPLARVIVDKSRVGRWRSDPRLLPYIGPLEGDMCECGYGSS